MPGWSELDKILNVAVDSLRKVEPVRDVQDKTQLGLRKLFDPVFEVFEKLHVANVHVTGNGTAPHRVPSGESLRQAVQSMSPPQVMLHLDRSTTLYVRIATRTGLTYPEIITTAKWRCFLVGNNVEIENKLLDNRNEMAKWVFTNVLAFTNHPLQNPGSNTGLPPPTVSLDDDVQPSRERRVIMLDDLTQ